MNARQAKWIALAALVAAPVVGFAQAGTTGSAGSNVDANKPAGAATAPSILPRDADRNAQGIGNIDDVAGSMSDGSRTTVQPEGRKPAGTEEMPPTLPRGTKHDNGRIGNMEDATGSMQRPPASSSQ